MNPKIAVIGAGNVGATCALYLAQQELEKLVTVGNVLDLLQNKLAAPPESKAA